MMKELKQAVLGLEESLRVDKDGRPAETEADAWQRFCETLTKAVDAVLAKQRIGFYDDTMMGMVKVRYCKKKDYALCSLRDGFCGVYDLCLRVLLDGRHVHIVYTEYWDSRTPPTYTVRDVVVREPREV